MFHPGFVTFRFLKTILFRNSRMYPAEHHIYISVFKPTERLIFNLDSKRNLFCANTNLSSNPIPCRSLTDFSPNDLRLQKYLNAILLEFNKVDKRSQVGGDPNNTTKKDIFKLQPAVCLIQESEEIKSDIKELDELINGLENQNDKELLDMALKDKCLSETRLEELQNKILHLIIPKEDIDDRDIILEINAGVGGQEAMLFAMDLYTMYCNFAAYKGWNFDIVMCDSTDIGGIRQAHLSISGKNVYKILKFESGVHRVQRIPKTERSGRIHTSTVTVVILPQPTEIEIVIKPQDISLEFTRSSGAGGQHVNKTDSCVRITHIPSGITVENQMERCQHRNRAFAMKTLRAKLYERELASITRSMNDSRKCQAASAERSEKVRTYNFPQSRITDHRAQLSVNNLEGFLQGQNRLNDFLNDLQEWSCVQALNELLKKYE